MSIHPSIIAPNYAKGARGGTELMAERLDRLPHDLLDGVQIWMSRYTPSLVDPSKRQILVVHDMPGDPMYDGLVWNSFDAVVYVSHWQRTLFEAMYPIPRSKGRVLRNAIEVSEDVAWHPGPHDNVHLVYHTTPHRGLDVLAAAFHDISVTDKNVWLNVYSSFAVYGQPGRDRDFKDVFDQLGANKQVKLKGTVSNAQIREDLKNMDVFVYPSTWYETSCLSLIEAMCAGLTCVHSSLGALPETSMYATEMYDYTDDKLQHVERLTKALREAIGNVRLGVRRGRTHQVRANQVYDWRKRSAEWIDLLQGLTSPP